MNYKKQLMPNGLRVLTAPRADTGAVTVLAMTNVGSRYETARNNGVSHFLEHMMFKGTEKRPTSRDVTKELDSVGAEFNAFTGKDYTGYYVKLGAEHIDRALDIIADMLWHSKFLLDEINRERTVVMEEINMYMDNPVMLIEDIFEERVFGPKHPLGRHISGPKAVIKKLSREDIVHYFERHYFPTNMVLTVAGKFNEASTLKAVEKLFGTTARGKKPATPVSFKQYQAKPQVTLVTRKTEQVQLGMGYPALPYLHKDLPALGLLAIILGGNMSSRLFVRVREKEGLAYSVHASRSSYTDTGAFYIQAGVDRQRTQHAVTVILEELARVKRDGVTTEELAHAKDYIRGKLTISLEDSEEIASYIARQELLTGIIKTPQQYLAEFRRVKRSDIQRVARAIFKPSKLNLAVIGPFKNAKEFQQLLER